MGALTEPALNPISGVAERRIEAAHQMFDIQFDEPNLTFLNPILAQTSLPYVEPPDNLPFYKCENGNVATTIVRGTLRNPYTNKFVLQGYPFGVKPRLMLMHICTRVTLTRKKEIYLGGSLKEFQKHLGIGYSNGGERGSLGPTKDQLMRLTASHLQLFCSDIANKRYSMIHPAPMISKFDFWLPTGLHEVSKWEGMITIGDEVFKCLMDGNMPLRTEAIMALQNSPMALDVYSWLSFRLWRIKESPLKPIPWSTLQNQFGPGYSRTRDFKRAFKETLAAVLKVYPEAKVRFSADDELVLYRSKPPVPQREVQALQSVLNFPPK
jgi:Plasmid encoded RepA protein